MRSLSPASPLLAAVIFAAGCDLDPTPSFGVRCVNDDSCGSGLSCDPVLGRCLPPDVAGSTCENAEEVTLSSRDGLAFGGSDLLLTRANTSANAGSCSEGRTAFVRLAVPAQVDADGAPLEGWVMRLSIDANRPAALALLDSDCTNEPTVECGRATAIGRTELILPMVAPGTHTIAITIDDDLDEPRPVSLVVEQIRCPAGFLPSGDRCWGFVRVRGPDARVGHTVTPIAPELALVAGGTRLASTTGPTSEAFVYSTSVHSFTLMPLRHGRSGHAAGLLDNGDVVVAGATDGTIELLRTEFNYFEELLIGDFPDPRVSLVPLGGSFAAILTRSEGCPQVLERIESDALSACTTTLGCPEGYFCAIEVPDFGSATDGRCLCASTACAGSGALAGWTAPSIYEAAPAHYRRGLAMAVTGAATAYAAMYVGGLSDPDADPNSCDSSGSLAPFPGAVFSAGRRSFAPFPPQLTQSLSARLDPAGVTIGGRAIVVGGRDQTERPLDTFDVFNPFVDQPASSGTLRSARAGAAVAIVSSSDVIVIGGVNAAGSVVRDTEIISLDTLETVAGPLLPFPLADAPSATMEGGQVLLVGGTSTDGPIGGALLLTEIAPSLSAPVFGAEYVRDPIGDTCGSAVELDGTSGVIQSATSDLVNHYDARTLCEQAGGFDYTYGPDGVFVVEVPPKNTLELHATTSALSDVALIVVDTCPVLEDTCVGFVDAGFTGEAENLSIPASPDRRTLWIIVDTFFDRRAFDFTLEWSVTGP